MSTSTSTPSELAIAEPYSLKPSPLPLSAPHNPHYHGRYVRFAGSLTRIVLPSVVLTEGSPKYLRFYFDPAGKQMAGYEERMWGFVFNGGDAWGVT